jgi:hypothetical protein
VAFIPKDAKKISSAVWICMVDEIVYTQNRCPNMRATMLKRYLNLPLLLTLALIGLIFGGISLGTTLCAPNHGIVIHPESSHLQAEISQLKHDTAMLMISSEAFQAEPQQPEKKLNWSLGGNKNIASRPNPFSHL